MERVGYNSSPLGQFWWYNSWGLNMIEEVDFRETTWEGGKTLLEMGLKHLLTCIEQDETQKNELRKKDEALRDFFTKMVGHIALIT